MPRAKPQSKFDVAQLLLRAGYRLRNRAPRLGIRRDLVVLHSVRVRSGYYAEWLREFKASPRAREIMRREAMRYRSVLVRSASVEGESAPFPVESDPNLEWGEEQFDALQSNVSQQELLETIDRLIEPEEISIVTPGDIDGPKQGRLRTDEILPRAREMCRARRR